MAFNKSKALESALKFLNQGKVNQAIAEYQQILRNDPKDQATLMTVGDLFARQGDMQHALEYFERLAQVYLADGFNSKAIAIYKKIAKLAPQEIAPLERLADLYVQQGVLSEARPLFLQIAEAHLKANRAPKAVQVLRRLLEVEPENPRVQMRLAELYNVMGQKGDAAKTYLAYAQRLYDHGETGEAEKLIERALEVVPGDSHSLLLKGKILVSSGKDSQAIKLLNKHPEADAGGEVTNMLVDLELKTGDREGAADRARNQLVRGNSHFGLLFRVTEKLVEAGRAEEALPLFRELRDPMIELGEHDKFVKSLSAATEKLPGNTEALELLADFCRHTSDPFPLTVALTKLADVYEAQGNSERTEQVLEELVDRNRDDERLAARLEALRVRLGKSVAPAESKSAPEAAPSAISANAPERDGSVQVHMPGPIESATPAAPVVEEPLEPETQRYVAQALTDVDLFSSYGLTQKATNLLEAVLQRAPRHTPALERLLDLSVGASNDRRVAQLAATLEEVYRNREDRVNSERFGDLRRRYQSAAGLSDQDLTSASPAAKAPETHAEMEPSSAGAVPVEMSVDIDEPVLNAEINAEPQESDVEPQEFVIEEVEPVQAEALSADVTPGEEVDLSDEWEAMVQEVVEPPPSKFRDAAPPAPVAAGQIDHIFADSQETIELELPTETEAAQEQAADVPVFEIEDDSEEVEPLQFPDVPLPDTPVREAEFELELRPEPVQASAKRPTTTEEFISDLAGEVEGMEPLPEQEQSAQQENVWATPAASGVASSPQAVEAKPQSQMDAVPEPQAELNQLAEVFQEFRSELGELGDEEDEDLETHYNLGIAYREMGLLEEAIGEFQKVAQAVQKGKPFRYVMNCATLLALSFRDKGEPKIASLWYQRALEVPGLDQETIMALRYDLGISLEMAGESEAALDCFRQVYATNIDYRDVADRIATLQHH
ncbi:MAG TPA: tetratricopeptide repeat protein [Candidatus Acidoferrales bacterium]|jgi:tetratricopeptide (TPR) repeat protein|nr:tetratricopeptide repeat protein [Candidatus Acidoferrales bacterium]